jgi:hypothetical protein
MEKLAMTGSPPAKAAVHRYLLSRKNPWRLIGAVCPAAALATIMYGVGKELGGGRQLRAGTSDERALMLISCPGGSGASLVTTSENSTNVHSRSTGLFRVKVHSEHGMAHSTRNGVPKRLTCW